jgi:ketosteroid isomerase-like protein
MSTENVELARRLYEWMAAGETDRAFEVYDREIEWYGSRAPWLLELGFEPIVRGHDGLRRSLRWWLDAWESIGYRPTELVDAGDHVVAFVRVTARGRANAGVRRPRRGPASCRTRVAGRKEVNRGLRGVCLAAATRENERGLMLDHLPERNVR